MNVISGELRYAWRSLLASPGITALAVLTLALGIGATTAIVSVCDALLLQPLPYPDADGWWPFVRPIYQATRTRGSFLRLTCRNGRRARRRSK
jgi:hypothetical protein